MQGSKVFCRFISISSIAFGLSTIASWNEWNQYWNKTSDRVQTIDYNIFSHALPAKLSSVLTSKNYGELQRTLDSNYGLFNLVVTDCQKADLLCPEQKVIFTSNGSGDWKTLSVSARLSNRPFDLLRTPSPLIAEKSYVYPGSREQIFTKGANDGIIIGRVYYVRGAVPDFWSDYGDWLQNVWSTTGSHGFYALKTGSLISSGLVIWLTIEFLLYQQFIQKHQAILEQQRLKNQFNEIIERNSEYINRQACLLAEREEALERLEDASAQYQNYIQRLSDEIERLTNVRSQQEDSFIKTTQLLATRQQELEAARTDKLLTIEQLQQREGEIMQLQQHVDLLS